MLRKLHFAAKLDSVERVITKKIIKASLVAAASLVEVVLADDN